MDQQLTTQAVRSRFAGGRWSADPANSGVFPSPGDKGTLYVLIEVVGEERRREALAQELVELIREEYLYAAGGITNSLRQALRAANARVFKHNQEHPQEVPLMAGATCAVVRGRDLFLGQGGGALALHLHDDQVRFYPRLLGRERVSPIPLGLEENLRDVGLSHAPLGRGDVFVLASPVLRELVSEEELQRALAVRRGPEVLSRLESLAKGQELSLMVVKLEAEESRWSESGLGRVSFKFLERLRGKEFWQGWAMALRSGFRSFLRWARLIGKEMLPGESRRGESGLPGARRRRGAVPRRREVAPRAFPFDRRRAAIAGGILLLLLIAFVLGFNYIQERQAEEAAYQELLARIEEFMDLSEQATEAAAARGLLVEAEGLLTEALAEHPRDSRALALEGRFRARWDDVHGILRPPLTVALELGDTGEGPRRLVFQGGLLYLLDGGADQVYAFQWSSETRALQAPSGGGVIVAAGEQGEILDIVWAPEGGFRLDPALLVLTETRLLEYEPGSRISSVSLVSREIWQTPARTGGFFGSFYVLDPVSNAIWKYFATEAGYTLEPANWLDPEEEIDITSAVDMAIDGFIWVLKLDGEIYKLEQGFRRIFELDGLLEPLTQPVALYTDPDAEFVYVADAGLGSILQFDKRGNFVRQIKPGWEEEEIFGSIEAFVMIEQEGAAFVLAGGKLYIMDLRAVEVPSPTPAATP